MNCNKFTLYINKGGSAPMLLLEHCAEQKIRIKSIVDNIESDRFEIQFYGQRMAAYYNCADYINANC